MPRDSSTGVYTIYPGTHGVPNTAIESALYNANVDDVALDLNTPRPIIAGGTGATSAAAALAALNGETANQIVTNYDSDTILPGSFSSGTGASASPVTGHAFAGICYMAGASKVLEARDLNDSRTPPAKWVRTFISPGPWSAWAQEGLGLVDADARFVNTAGDTMAGNLAITPASGSATIALNKSAPGSSSVYYGMMASKARWVAEFGDAAAEGGGNAGSNFNLNRYDDAGTYLGTPITINRATGAVTIPSLVVSGVNVTSGLRVTDYNSIAGMGPIYSTSAGTTNSPAAAHAFNGHVYGQDLNNLVIEVRDISAYSSTVPSSVPAWVGVPATLYEVGQLARDTADNTIWIAINQQVANYAGTFAAYRALLGGTSWGLVTSTAIRYTRARIAGVWGTWIQL